MKNSSSESAPVEFRIEYRPTADQDFDDIPEEYLDKIFDLILALGVNPRPRGCIKLKGKKKRYRIRCGKYRIVYRINFDSKIVLVEFVRHRKNVYRDLD